MESLKVLEKTMDFCVWLFEHTQKFPKSSRFSIAVRIEQRVLELLECINEAASIKEKRAVLVKADLALRQLIVLIRLSHRLRFLNDGSYEFAAKSVTEIGRMLGGWLKTADK